MVIIKIVGTNIRNKLIVLLFFLHNIASCMELDKLYHYLIHIVTNSQKLHKFLYRLRAANSARLFLIC